MSINGVIAFIVLILALLVALISGNWRWVAAGGAIFLILAVVEAGLRLKT